MDAGQAHICVYSKAIHFYPKPYNLSLNFLVHAALLPTSQVLRGLHNLPSRHVEQSWALESNGPVPEP